MAHKQWHKMQRKLLTPTAREAKSLVLRICRFISAESGHSFTVEMVPWNGYYEGHVICDHEGMVFWGGHFSRKADVKALSKAWNSLLDDCIGIGCDGEDFNLSDNLRPLGLEVNLNFNSRNELDCFLREHGV